MSCFPFLSWQVGLIRLGQEQVLIQPLRNSSGPFSGREHVIRREWALTPSPTAEAQVPGQFCKVLTGELGQHVWTEHMHRWHPLCGTRCADII